MVPRGGGLLQGGGGMKPIKRAYVIVGLTIIGWLVVIGLVLVAAQIVYGIALLSAAGPR